MAKRGRQLTRLLSKLTIPVVRNIRKKPEMQVARRNRAAYLGHL